MARTVVPDAVFPSQGQLEIPLLRMDMQADFIDLPCLQYGSRHSRRVINRGTWHFYVDDYRFQTIWDDPERIVDTGVRTCVEPNPSIFDQTPTAMAVGLVYRKRWIARYWQERGVRVIVDLNVAERHMSLNLRGVPSGWRSYATRAYHERPDDLQREYEVACRHRGGSDVWFLVVGGVWVRKWCEQHQAVWVRVHKNFEDQAKSPHALRAASDSESILDSEKDGPDGQG
jgi:hypothetical protein